VAEAPPEAAARASGGCVTPSTRRPAPRAPGTAPADRRSRGR
jgi:hypothetical protein